MSERTTSRVIPRLGPHDSIPLLTEVIDLPATQEPADPALGAASADGVIDTADMPDSGVVTQVGNVGEDSEGHAGRLSDLNDMSDLSDVVALHDVVELNDVVELDDDRDPPILDATPYLSGEDDLRAVRSELLTRVMMRFRTEWPQVVEAHTEATLQSRLAPLSAQLAAELTLALEARLVEWLDATLEEIERDPIERDPIERDPIERDPGRL
ncbi:hypothetical protein [Cupriavidus plantarum]|uniref:hypothetical protein n=1 Tax=Cupriavidus plantarum TaxID=942865 RepID=UPI00339D9565